jgi:L-fuconolactonase
VLGVVGFVDLCAPSAAVQLDHFRAQGCLVGVRHLVQDEPRPHFLERDDFRRGLRELGPRELVFDLLVRERQRAEALHLVRDFPAQRFVLDHLGKPPVRRRELDPWRSQMADFARCPNVHCKLSGLATEAGPEWGEQDLAPYVDVALETFGPARLLFGSDWPVCLLAGDAARVAAAHLEPLRRLSPSEFRAVTHENAVHVYRLSP